MNIQETTEMVEGYLCPWENRCGIALFGYYGVYRDKVRYWEISAPQHYYVTSTDGETIYDPTAQQFSTTPDYSQGVELSAEEVRFRLGKCHPETKTLVRDLIGYMCLLP